MTKTSRQKFKYLENKKSFEDEIKNIFHHFQRGFIEVSKINIFGRYKFNFNTVINTISNAEIFRQCCC